MRMARLFAFLSSIMIATVSSAVNAEEWLLYENARFGYALGVPSELGGQGESYNGDGQVFASSTAKLTVFGQNLVQGDFEDEVAWRHKLSRDDGWSISYQVTTPNRASFSGAQGARVLYARMVSLCDAQFAMFTLEYSVSDVVAFNPIVERLVETFRPTRC